MLDIVGHGPAQHREVCTIQVWLDWKSQTANHVCVGVFWVVYNRPLLQLHDGWISFSSYFDEFSTSTSWYQYCLESWPCLCIFLDWGRFPINCCNNGPDTDDNSAKHRKDKKGTSEETNKSSLSAEASLWGIDNCVQKVLHSLCKTFA